MRTTVALGVGSFILSLTCAACGASSSAPTTTTPRLVGVVTGYADPCIGRSITEYEYNRIPMRVALSRENTVVAQQTGHGSLHFRLTAPPGTYVVSAKGAGESKTVTVLAHQTTTINLDPGCL